MNFILSESKVHKRTVFTMGKYREPNLDTNRLFLYMNEKAANASVGDSEGAFQVGPSETPVSEKFIAKNKITRRIEILRGPHEYTFEEKFLTKDARKEVLVTVDMQFIVVDSFKLYKSKISGVSSLVKTVFLKELSQIVASHQIEEIHLIRERIETMQTFPELLQAVSNVGLQIEKFSALLKRDSIQEEIDNQARILEASQRNTLVTDDFESEREIRTEVRNSLKEMQLIDHFLATVSQASNPVSAIEYVPAEIRGKVSKRLVEMGVLEIDYKIESESEKVTQNPFGTLD